MPPTALSPSKALTSTHSRGFDDTSTAAASLPNPPSHKAERGIYSEMLSQNEGQVGAESMLIEEARMQQLPPVSEEGTIFCKRIIRCSRFFAQSAKMATCSLMEKSNSARNHSCNNHRQEYLTVPLICLCQPAMLGLPTLT